MKTALLFLFTLLSFGAIGQLASLDNSSVEATANEKEASNQLLDIASVQVITEGCTCIMKWMTLTEGNRSLFVVEKSIDGRPFQKIATAHTSGEPSEYIMFDEYFHKDARYRLRSLDTDNRIEFEEILTVESPCPARLGVSK